MAFDAVLLTAYPRSGRLHVWLLGSGRIAVPANSVIPRLCVCRHVSAGHGARSPSLWPHCVVEGNNKAATTEASPDARRTNSCPVCPAFSWEPAWWRHGMDTARGRVSLKTSTFSSLWLGRALIWLLFFLLKGLCERYYCKSTLKHERYVCNYFCSTQWQIFIATTRWNNTPQRSKFWCHRNGYLSKWSHISSLINKSL